jgi:general secretion pathway protein C
VIDTYFKQHFWTFRLGVLAILAILAARAANVFVAGMVRLPPSAIAQAPVKPSTDDTVSKKSTVPTQSFLERNIFGAAREDLEAQAAAAAEDAPAKVDVFNADQCEKTTLRAKLVGTIVSSDRTRSVAIFTDASNVSTGLYEGEQIEAGKIVSIEWREVKVDHLGRCEKFSLNDDQPTVASAAPVEPPVPEAGNVGGDESKVALGEGVKKVKDDQYEIPRAEIDNVLSNLNAVATQARIVPSFQNGKANGFKLFSIRPNSLYSKIGIQNGDVVQKINGYEINSPDKALEIYSKLKDAQSITVDLIRRGKTQTLNYAIR